MINSNQLQIAKTSLNDLPRIYQLLEELDLPTIGITDHIDNFFLAIQNGSAVGIIGLEIYHTTALLRSVGVKKSHQGNKIGDDLMIVIQEYAKFKSIKEIYLFTDTAETWFERYGFTIITNNELDPILELSKEYTLCASSVKMVKSIDALEGNK